MACRLIAVGYYKRCGGNDLDCNGSCLGARWIMCFYNDYEWTAEITAEWTAPIEVITKCDECKSHMNVGSEMTFIHMQEYEECYRCAECECDCPRDKDGDCVGCQCEPPEFGETFDYVRCEQCGKFLKAVEAAELKAGCRLSDSRPALGNMIEEIQDGDNEGAQNYFETAREMFPELVNSGYLSNLFELIFRNMESSKGF
jgi:hypothetical protein